ncbi:hypothetical protein COCMIDRAFT_108900 [Bipolaris oryzae ATCC 44560]|uniref:Phenylacetaldoxime dehydratase n=1 Tax=Bipolaris oryzae ATCC 44560 TaxID=930090 RepID=W6YXX5_COCMI|nr:uncharacterized protein COCMIDRAFT_108900 [Bipolaris oryzae ATCC 44560]EUC40409.1 hypothetical protein COCMIDRAFT_108900 [Bipolaris oryzae ATCC 44560]
MKEARSLEHAIPSHLQTERTIPAKTSDRFVPPFPSYTARFPKEAKHLVMAIIGVQYKDSVNHQGPAYQKLVSFVEQGSEKSKPKYWEAAITTDNRSFCNEVVIPYWQTKADFEEWRSDSGFDDWWANLQAESERGWFMKIFFPTIDRFETVFSDNVVPAGAAHMRSSVSGEMQQHFYWGSMRDRLAAAQTDHLIGERAFPKSFTEQVKKGDTRKQRITLPGRKNLAVIRSGQDWSDTNPSERKLYLETMHPVLTKGMEFLRDKGEEVGCISNRFMECIYKTSPRQNTERTFSLAYFDDLKSLEGWSKEHKTHLDIFGRFSKYASELQGNVSLRLFHEVMVLKPEQQFFEYIGCHDSTGMLASVKNESYQLRS